VRRKTYRVSNPLYGLITVAVLAAFVYVVFFGFPFGGGFEVKAVLRNAPEVQPGSKVRIAGVNVGKVKATEIGPAHGLATITLELEDQALPLHRDATLKVRPRTFLEGGMFVDLHPGRPRSPELAEGGTIPVAATASPVLLGHATADLRFSTRENLRLLVRALRQSLEGGGADSLHRAQRHAAPALRGLAQFAEAARGENQRDLSRAVRGSATTLGAIASRDTQLAELLTGFNRSARALGARRVELGQSLEELDGVLAEARPALAELNRLFPHARAFAADLRPSIRAAPATLRLALPFLDQAQGLLRDRELPALLRQADPAVRSLAKLEPPLATVLGQVTPVTECLRVNAVPKLKETVDDPPNTTGDPVYRDLLHSMPALASVAQNFDGNGPAIRYHAGFGNRMVSLNVPGLGDPVVGLTSQPIIGSRPRYTGVLPPFRPRVPCTSQAPPNLKAQDGPAPVQTAVAAAPINRKLRRLQSLWRKRGAGR
jgi:phospholipid/cholesterol/gamma-HCH transport system substrate-binding protein